MLANRSEYPICDTPLLSDSEWSRVNNNNKRNQKTIIAVFRENLCTPVKAEKFKNILQNSLDQMTEMRNHCCEVFSAAMGMHVVNMRVDLSNHYVKEYCSATNKWEYSQFIVHFRATRDDPNEEGNVIIEDFEYKFSPKTRRGKILRHCYFILKLIAEIVEDSKYIVDLNKDEEEWERDLLFE